MSGFGYSGWSKCYPEKRIAFLNLLSASQKQEYQPVTLSIPLRGEGLSDMYDYLEKGLGVQLRWMFLSPRRFSDVRRFGRDILDIETGSVPQYAFLWGVGILVEATAPSDELVMVDSENRTYRFKLIEPEGADDVVN